MNSISDMEANSTSSKEILRLNRVVQRLHATINTKGRSWFRKLKKPAVRFQQIRDSITALDKDLMDILHYNNYNSAEGRPPSMMEVIETAGLKREVGPSNIEQFLEVHIQLLEAFFKGSEKSVAGENIVSLPGEDIVSMAEENTEPLPKYSPNPSVIGHGNVDPSVIKNYELVFTELQGKQQKTTKKQKKQQQ
ncbi:hypothetical protein BGZ46_009911 [Entomortierella lignicola]|nr:hypothetical protein BGZ46_009911 [Entomortierella lignicola]